MNMSQFSVPSASLCESLHLASLQPPSMHCGNHGNSTALSVKAARCNVSERKADGESSEVAGNLKRKDGEFVLVTRTCLCCFLSFFFFFFAFLQLWAVSKKVSGPSRSPRERAPSFPRRAFAASPSRRSPGSGTDARSRPAVACEFVLSCSV